MCVLYKTSTFSLFSFSSAGRAGGWWQSRGSSWSSRWHRKSHLTYFSPSFYCLSAAGCLLICFLYYQGPPGDRGERGESGDPGYKVSSLPSLRLILKLSKVFGFMRSILLLLFLRVKLVWMEGEAGLELLDYPWVSKLSSVIKSA